VIRIPASSTFHSQEDYFHTLYHEMIHNAETGIMPHGAGRRRL
jgi:antirestriction protein ArdC